MKTCGTRALTEGKERSTSSVGIADASVLTERTVAAVRLASGSEEKPRGVDFSRLKSELYESLNSILCVPRDYFFGIVRHCASHTPDESSKLFYLIQS